MDLRHFAGIVTFRNLRGFHFSLGPVLCTLLSLCILTGCSHLDGGHTGEYVYVMAKQTYLRDRVAAVSNKVGTVYNGERVEVVDHGRRFIKVKTTSGATGWLEDHMVIDQASYDKFKALHDQHVKDPAVTTAVLRDDLYAHLLPGRDTARFLLLPENDKLELLQRASVPKPDAQAAWMRPQPKEKGPNVRTASVPSPAPKKAEKKGKHATRDHWLDQFIDPNAPPLEDWWLVRDGAGRIGWVLARRLDVDVPDEVVQYSEGQRIVGAYLLNKVSDPDSKFPDGLAPNYLALLSPYKDGLPYDFDQIRVYAWNVKKHRYEGAYRKRDVAGYLPATVTHQVEETSGEYAGVAVPVFTVKIATDDAVPSLDPGTGLVRPVPTEDETFSLEGEMVKRIMPGAPVTVPKAAAPKPADASAPKAGRERHERRHHKKHRPS